MDRLTEADVRRAGTECEVIEDYLDRPEGHTLLLLGYVAPERPIHLVVGCEAFERDWSKPVILITVYLPEPPMWSDERTRAGKRR